MLPLLYKGLLKHVSAAINMHTTQRKGRRNIREIKKYGNGSYIENQQQFT
jgi:hypothetical protein